LPTPSDGRHDRIATRIAAVTTTAWFHCFAGIAGDMALGSLIDAGAPVAEVRSMLARLPVGGWELDATTVMRSGLAATHAVVRAPEDGSVVRTYSHITGLIEEARLPDRVRERSLKVFTALAEAEAHVHRRPIHQVHFHEVGGIDALIDIVGTCVALELLEIDDVVCSPISLGMGLIQAEHGTLPNPVPAVAALLATRRAPTIGREIKMELTTPTGAAIVCALATSFGPTPAMTATHVGYGAGTRDLEGFPNALQVIIGERTARAQALQPLVLLEANVDDTTGEILAHTVAQALDAGAMDAWITPIVMKKGRPAHIISALTDSSMAEQVAAVMISETGSLGVRATQVHRWAARRSFDEVEVEGLPVRVKVGAGRAKAEFDDAAKVAKRANLPVREVMARAETAWRRAQEVRALHPAHRPQEEP
jgi:pyridinium-3,5-bisthiocarboxylic acid mononucleotide nickel chelatase